MINVREGSFETNSSSTHNIVIVEDSQLEKWKKGEIFYIENGNRFVSKYEYEDIKKADMGKFVMEYSEDSQYREDIIEAIKENRLKEYVNEMINDGEWYYDTWDKPLSYSEWLSIWENRELEGDTEEYKTPKGETIHVFCQYGYEG